MPDDAPSLVSPPAILTPTLAAVDDTDEERCEELTRGRGRKAAEDADADGGGGGIGTPALLSPPTCVMVMARDEPHRTTALTTAETTGNTDP